jgi:hypothetical protein
MKLSDIQCKNAKYDSNEKPNGSKHKLMDGGGLFLHIKPKGKYWHFKYRFGQKQKLLSFGVYPEVIWQQFSGQYVKKIFVIFQTPPAINNC